jgi:glycosyltransferase involved in cell wall biosynthesis
MKIALTTDTYWPRINGVTVSIDSLRRCLRTLGHTVYVIAPAYPPAEGSGSVPDDEHVFRLPAFSFPLSPEDRVGYPSARLHVPRLLEDLKPDVVHSQTEFTIGFGGKAYCLRHDVPHFMTCHTWYEHYITTYFPLLPASFARAVASSWSRADYRLIDGLVVPSRWMQGLVRSYGVDCPIEVIPTGIDPDDFSLAPDVMGEAAARFHVKVPDISGRRILLYTGRIAKEKNIDFLLGVMQRIRESAPDALLVLAGRGPQEARLQESVRAQGLEAHVRFAGYLDRRELTYVLSRAEAFVFASKTETQGLVLVEAMMCRVPVVAVRARGTEEFLVDDKGGYLVEEDVEQFAAKVRLLLSDRDTQRQKREEARTAAQEWTAQSMTSRLLALYDGALRARQDQDSARSA